MGWVTCSLLPLGQTLLKDSPLHIPALTGSRNATSQPCTLALKVRRRHCRSLVASMSTVASLASVLDECLHLNYLSSMTENP